jgi:hypothetical protein
LRVALEKEMQSKGIFLSVGDFGEHLAIKFFKTPPPDYIKLVPGTPIGAKKC